MADFFGAMYNLSVVFSESEGLHRASSSGMASKVFKSFRTFWWIGSWHLQQLVIMLL